jgi:hypothetical protein
MKVSKRVGQVAMVVALAGCAMWPVRGPEPPSYRGDDAATVNISTVQIGCCYTEGSLHFARLDGRTSGEFSLESDVREGGNMRDPRPVGAVELSLAPGRYQLEVWERPCDANCGNLDGPTGQAQAEFEVAAGEEISIAIQFVLLRVTTIKVIH